MTIKLIFVDHSGAEQIVGATEGQSVMQAALAAGIDGIAAECNGSAACATCHAFFEDSILERLPEMGEHENDMLDFAATERREGSRLSCQVPVTQTLDGARVTLPETQLGATCKRRAIWPQSPSNRMVTSPNAAKSA